MKRMLIVLMLTVILQSHAQTISPLKTNKLTKAQIDSVVSFRRAVLQLRRAKTKELTSRVQDLQRLLPGKLRFDLKSTAVEYQDEQYQLIQRKPGRPKLQEKKTLPNTFPDRQEVGKPAVLYQVPFASQGNQIELSVKNSSSDVAKNVQVGIVNPPSWVHFASPEQKISEIKPNEEAVAQFSFSVDGSAPVGQRQTLSFVIRESSGRQWTKEISIVTAVPEQFELLQNYPNPFNPTTVISYQLPVVSRVSLKVYNLLGQEVATLVDGEQIAGYYRTVWEARGFASGMYLYRLMARDNAGKLLQERKAMVLLK